MPGVAPRGAAGTVPSGAAPSGVAPNAGVVGVLETAEMLGPGPNAMLATGKLPAAALAPDPAAGGVATGPTGAQETAGAAVAAPPVGTAPVELVDTTGLAPVGMVDGADSALAMGHSRRR